MLRETKIGNVIIVAQTTFYAYESQEKRLEDKFFLCTNNEKEIEMLKKRLEGNKGLQPIECTPGELDDVKERFKNFSYFTIGRGKAIYHLIHLPDRSYGIYYALRVTPEGLTGKRALESHDKITCWGEI